jgi:antitoxin YefM
VPGRALARASRAWNERAISFPISASNRAAQIDAIILYMTTLPLADARAQLSKLVKDAATTHERFEITRNGRRAAVLLSADDYDIMQETMSVLSDSSLLAAHATGQAEITSGEYLDADGLAALMRRAGPRAPADE